VEAVVAQVLGRLSPALQQRLAPQAARPLSVPEADDDDADQNGHEDDHTGYHQDVVDRIVDHWTIVEVACSTEICFNQSDLE